MCSVHSDSGGRRPTAAATRPAMEISFYFLVKGFWLILVKYCRRLLAHPGKVLPKAFGSSW